MFSVMSTASEVSTSKTESNITIFTDCTPVFRCANAFSMKSPCKYLICYECNNKTSHDLQGHRILRRNVVPSHVVQFPRVKTISGCNHKDNDLMIDSNISWFKKCMKSRDCTNVATVCLKCGSRITS